MKIHFGYLQRLLVIQSQFCITGVCTKIQLITCDVQRTVKRVEGNFREDVLKRVSVKKVFLKREFLKRMSLKEYS